MVMEPYEDESHVSVYDGNYVRWVILVRMLIEVTSGYILAGLLKR